MTKRRMITTASKSSYASKNRGIDLLDETIEQIELHAKAGSKGQWYQDDYRCGSGMCLAGWASQLAGGQWAFSLGDSHYHACLIAEPGDPKDEMMDVAGVRVVHADVRAQRLLGLTPGQADSLFGAGNNLFDIKAMRDQIATGTWTETDYQD